MKCMPSATSDLPEPSACPDHVSPTMMDEGLFLMGPQLDAARFDPADERLVGFFLRKVRVLIVELAGKCAELARLMRAGCVGKLCDLALGGRDVDRCCRRWLCSDKVAPRTGSARATKRADLLARRLSHREFAFSSSKCSAAQPDDASTAQEWHADTACSSLQSDSGPSIRTVPLHRTSHP